MNENENFQKLTKNENNITINLENQSNINNSYKINEYDTESGKISDKNTQNHVNINKTHSNKMDNKVDSLYYDPLEICFFVIFTFLITVILQFCNYVIFHSKDARLYFCSYFPWLTGFMLWISTGLILTILATLPGIYISKYSNGSGITEIKALLEGNKMPGMFTIPSIVGKIIATVLAVTGGMSIGRNGSYVMISCAIYTLMLKLKYFKRLDTENFNLNMISLASACGMTLSLGSLIGGVLFSLEVTSSSFKIEYLSKIIFCTVLTTVYSNLLNLKEYSNLVDYSDTHIPNLSFSYFDYFLFLVIAITLGLIGAFLNRILANLVVFRKKAKENKSFFIIYNPIVYSSIISLIIGLITFILPPLMQEDRDVMKLLINTSQFKLNSFKKIINNENLIRFKTLQNDLVMNVDITKFENTSEISRTINISEISNYSKFSFKNNATDLILNINYENLKNRLHDLTNSSNSVYTSNNSSLKDFSFMLISDDYFIDDVNPKLKSISKMFDINKLSELSSSTNIIKLSKIDNNHSPEMLTLYNNSAFYLLMLLIFKTISTVLSLTCDLPTGMFGTFFVVGAYYGRIIAHIMIDIFGEKHLSSEYVYSIIGSTCLISASTQTFATPFIVFELTGISGILPVLLIFTIISNLVSKTFSESYYDIFRVIRNIPSLPDIRENSNFYNLKIKDIVNKNMFYIKRSEFTILNSLKCLCQLPRDTEIPIPIIDDNRIIITSIKPYDLTDKISRMFSSLIKEFKTNINSQQFSSDFFQNREYKKVLFIIDFLYLKFRKDLLSNVVQRYSNFNKFEKNTNDISEQNSNIEDQNNNQNQNPLKASFENVYGNVKFIKHENIYDKSDNIRDTIELSVTNRNNIDDENNNKNFQSNISETQIKDNDLDNNLNTYKEIPVIGGFIRYTRILLEKIKMEFENNISLLKHNISVLTLSAEEKEKLSKANLIIDNQILYNIKEIENYEEINENIEDKIPINSKSFKSIYSLESRVSCLRFYYFLTSLNLHYIFVVENSKLIGYITKKHFIKACLET